MRADPMNSDEIRRLIRGYLVDRFLHGDPTLLRDDLSLEGAHILDSVQSEELILFLEETFAITVFDTEPTPENFGTVDALVAYVGRKIGLP